MKNTILIYPCDFCGEKKEVFRTHYGSGFKYVRLMCRDCEKKINSLHREAQDGCFVKEIKGEGK